MAAEKPFQLDVGRWRKAPELGRARALTRGVWLELLMVMHEQDESGELSGTLKDLASDGRCSLSEMRIVVSDLATYKIADVTERNGIVTLTNRLMRREYLARKSNQTRQQRFRQRQRGDPDNAESNGAVTSAGHVSVLNIPESASSGKKELSSRVNELFGYWKEIMGHPNAKLTGGREAKMRARYAEGYTLEQMKQAVDGCRASAYHMGANDQRIVYDDIELICRSGQKVEQFIGYLNRPIVKEIPNAKPNFGDKQNAAIRDAFAGIGGRDNPDVVGIERRLQAPGASRGGTGSDEGELDTRSGSRAGQISFTLLRGRGGQT